MRLEYVHLCRAVNLWSRNVRQPCRQWDTMYRVEEAYL